MGQSSRKQSLLSAYTHVCENGIWLKLTHTHTHTYIHTHTHTQNDMKVKHKCRFLLFPRADMLNKTFKTFTSRVDSQMESISCYIKLLILIKTIRNELL